ncbi:hypothetical protein [Chryseobacterium sp. YIM B08800]|uniref:hypothetical protein n=1 Tax=Chryseobacterium sp. YIM B08800 TaxID=2984136 RepID=UPI00224039CF|nr:hypothetical protein [Chryseobacterium sp. YIM B08800]
MKLLLIFVCIFLTLYKVDNVSLTVTYSDVIFLVLFIIFVNDFFKKGLSFDKFSKLWTFYLAILVISGLINFTFLEGRFLNIFKTYFFSLILYIMVYSYRLKNKIKIKTFCIYTIILCSFFLVKTWGEMQSKLSNIDTGFTNVDLFESSLNLNTWGYILVLFLVFTFYCLINNIYTKFSLMFSAVILIFIFFSYSRTAYSLSILSIVWTFLFVNKKNMKNIIIPILFISIIYLLWETLDLKTSDAALDFIDKKSGNYGDDLINTRFYIINIEPLIENYEKFNPIQAFIGDGVSVQHSFFSHTLIVTGIVGFVIYIKRYIYIIKYLYSSIKKKLQIKKAKMLLLLVIIILINDFVTNVSAYLPFAAYLSSIIMAYIIADINKIKMYGVERKQY